MSVDDCKLFDENLLFSNFAEDCDEQLQQQQSTNLNSAKSRKRKLSNTATVVDEIPCEGVDNEITEIETQKNKYIQELEEQNSKLKAIIKRLCGPHDFFSNDVEMNNGDEQAMAPLAVVLYLSNKVCQARKIEIDQFFRDLSERDATKDLFVTQELRHQPSAIPLRPFSSDSHGKRFHKSKKGRGKQDSYVVTSVQYLKGFCFDRLGEPLLDLDASITQNWEVPSYEQIFMKALPILEEGSKVIVRKVKTLSCFNCEGNHNLNECKEPRDFAKISANRRAFQEKFGSPSTPDSRYHVSQGDDERFQAFKPGTMSESLRKALGMRDSDLPPYIYRMRMLGYPPGYLKPIDPELVFYNAEGYVEETDFNEDGEIIQPREQPKIFYPGFNAPLPEGVIDRGYDHGVPLYQPEPHRDDRFGENEQYFRRPIEREVGDDMEIGEEPGLSDGYGQPPVPIEIGEERPPLPVLEPDPRDDSRAAATRDEIQRKVESILSTAKKEAEHNVVLDTYLKGVQNNDQENESAILGSCRQWWLDQPLNSIGTIYCTYTPPPSLKGDVVLKDIPASVVTELDREPWKTASMSWYDPLYGDLAERTGMYESIREILKNRKKKKRKKL